MTTKSVQIIENERIHFFFPDFNEEFAIIKERRMEHDWKVEPMMALPRVLLENITSIRLQDDVEFDYKVYGRLLPESRRCVTVGGLRQKSNEQSSSCSFLRISVVL